jgi:hypothetical protein
MSWCSWHWRRRAWPVQPPVTSVFFQVLTCTLKDTVPGAAPAILLPLVSPRTPHTGTPSVVHHPAACRLVLNGSVVAPNGPVVALSLSVAPRPMAPSRRVQRRRRAASNGAVTPRPMAPSRRVQWRRRSRPTAPSRLATGLVFRCPIMPRRSVQRRCTGCPTNIISCPTPPSDYAPRRRRPASNNNCSLSRARQHHKPALNGAVVSRSRTLSGSRPATPSSRAPWHRRVARTDAVVLRPTVLLRPAQWRRGVALNGTSCCIQQHRHAAPNGVFDLCITALSCRMQRRRCAMSRIVSAVCCSLQ